METDKPPIPTDKPSIPTADWLKWLGERRDGFLIAGAVLYGLGYVVWSYNAWRNHLGQLPAIEFQYLMSGLIPGAIIGMGLAATAFFSRMRDKAIAVFEKHRFLSNIITGVIFLALTGLNLTAITLGQRKEQATLYTLPLIAAIMYLSLITNYPVSKRPPSRFGDTLESLSKYLLVVMFCGFSLAIYVNVYPRLPQELGGPQPRCAYIDLVREEIAPSSLAVLVPSRPVDTATASQSKVVRSNKLNVYFSSNDYLLVRTATHAKDASSADLKNAPLYELRKEVIRLVEWCPR